MKLNEKLMTKISAQIASVMDGHLKKLEEMIMRCIEPRIKSLCEEVLMEKGIIK